MQSIIRCERPWAILAWAYSFALISLVTLCGCQSPEKHYSLKGRVVAKDPSEQQITVDNEDIPGFVRTRTDDQTLKLSLFSLKQFWL